MVDSRLFFNSDDNTPIPNMRTNEFALDEEVIRRLVERIIRLEVEQETLSRRIREMVFSGDNLGSTFDEENSRLLLWNRLLCLEEDQRVVQRCLQEVLVKDLVESDGCGSASDRVEPNNILQETLNKSSIVGMKYPRIHSNSLCIRLFWYLVILLNLSLCGVSVFHAYNHWLAAPTTDRDVNMPLGVIPFPAVTVCVGHSVRSSSLMDTLLRQCSKGACGSQELGRLEAAALLCPSLLQTTPLQLQPWSNYFNSSSLLFIQQLFPACTEEIASYHWPDRGTSSCSSAFQTLYVDGRICYSYNLLPANRLFQKQVSTRPVVMDETRLQGTAWSLDSPHRPTSTSKTAPLHKDSAGVDQRLRINLERTVLQHPLSPDPAPFTYRVAVHQPWELPSVVSHHFLLLPLSHSLHVAVTPRLVTSASTPSTPCLSQQLSPLLMFSHYSRSNCLLECRAQCSLSLCGCVSLHLPRVKNTTKWCGLARRYCSDTLVPDLVSGKITWEAVTKFYQKEIREELLEKIVDNVYSSPGQEGLTDQVLKSLEPNCACDCPQSCVSLSYHLETQSISPSQGIEDRSLQNKSEINVYYKEGQDLFVATEKISIFNFTDFLAHCGGLLALFTGLSVIAVAEFLFLLTGLLNKTKKQSNGRNLHQNPEPTKNIVVEPDAFFITNPTTNMGL